MRTVSVIVSTALACGAVLGQQNQVLIDTFARPILVGMQLSLKRSFEQGHLGQEQFNCLMALPQSRFDHVVRDLLAASLSAEEIESAERFFASPSGRAYANQGLAGVYTAVGVEPPFRAPDLTASDQAAIASFAASTAGTKLIRDKILEAPSARQKLSAAIREVAEPCRQRR